MHTIELYFVHTQSTSLPCAARRIIPLALCVRSNHWVMIEQLRHAGKKKWCGEIHPPGNEVDTWYIIQASRGRYMYLNSSVGKPNLSFACCK